MLATHLLTVTYYTGISIHMHCVYQLKFAFAITDHRRLVGGVYSPIKVPIKIHSMPILMFPAV